MKKEGEVTIYEKDIATIEGMHDTLFDYLDWPIDSALLKSSRNLTSRMNNVLIPSYYELRRCEANLKIGIRDLDTLQYLNMYAEKCNPTLKSLTRYSSNREKLISKFKNALL